MPARRSNRCPCPETEASLRLVCVYLLRSIVWRTIGTEGHVHRFLLFWPCFLFQESRKVWSPDTVNESDSSCRVVRDFPSCKYLSSWALTDMNSAINLCFAASSSVMQPLYMRSTQVTLKGRIPLIAYQRQLDCRGPLCPGAARTASSQGSQTVPAQGRNCWVVSSM